MSELLTITTSDGLTYTITTTHPVFLVLVLSSIIVGNLLK